MVDELVARVETNTSIAVFAAKIPVSIKQLNIRFCFND